MDQVNKDYLHVLNEVLQQNNNLIFWKTVKQRRCSSRPYNISMDVKSRSDFYRSAMRDSGSGVLTDVQLDIKDMGSRKYKTMCG